MMVIWIHLSTNLAKWVCWIKKLRGVTRPKSPNTDTYKHRIRFVNLSISTKILFEVVLKWSFLSITLPAHTKRKAMSSPGKKRGKWKFWELVTKSYQGTRHQYRSDPLSDPSPLDLFRWPHCWGEDFRTPLFSYLQLKSQRHQELSRLVWPCWCWLAASRRHWQASFWFWETLLFCNFWRKGYGSWNCFTVFVFCKGDSRGYREKCKRTETNRLGCNHM